MTAPSDSPVRALLEPSSIAVVGASPKPGFNRAMIENFVSLAYPGQVAAVNPNYDEVVGIPCYPTLKDVPFVPEAVVVGVNRMRVIPVLEQAAEVGARAAVIFATGLAEVAGGDQAAAEQQLRDIAIAAGMAVVGPNCQGTINFRQPNALYMRPVQPYRPGRVALVSQSGSITTAVANNRRGVRWSYVISTGNEAVTGVEDLLGYLVDDPGTSTIVAFLETIRRPEAFFAQCERAAAAGKPLVVVKSGRSAAAAEAAVAHSGALAVSDRLVGALFRRYRVIRAESLDELLNVALLLETGRRPRAAGVGAVTGSGGEIELLLDEAARHGLALPELSAETAATLRGLLPEELPPGNPLDSSDVDRARFVANHPRVLEAVLSDENVGALVVTMGLGSTPTGRPNPGGFKNDAAKALATTSDKLVTMIDLVGGTPDPDLVEDLAGHGVAMMSGLADSVRALVGVLEHARPARARANPPAPDGGAALAALQALGDAPASGRPALDVVAALGIPVVPSHTVGGADEAVARAREIGYPVALKVADPHRLHKTEVGGVIVGIGDETGLRAAVQRLHEDLGPEPLLLQPHVAGATELILGLERRPGLGSFVMIGMGGIWTELFDDVSVRPAGLLLGEARDMLEELRGWPLLTGARGRRPAAVPGVIDAIQRLDCAALELGDLLAGVDINPLMVGAAGVVAVDALVVPGPVGP